MTDIARIKGSMADRAEVNPAEGPGQVGAWAPPDRSLVPVGLVDGVLGALVEVPDPEL